MFYKHLDFLSTSYNKQDSPLHKDLLSILGLSKPNGDRNYKMDDFGVL